MVLYFKEAEKQHSDTVVLPRFSLAVEAGVITAVHSNVNTRQQLMELLMGKSTLSGGKILFKEKLLARNSPDIGLFFLEAGVYERLTVQETLRLYSRLIQAGEYWSHCVGACAVFVLLHRCRNASWAMGKVGNGIVGNRLAGPGDFLVRFICGSFGSPISDFESLDVFP
jgi:ABC-type branched-subunit amino acid transport system ATPase component